MQWYYSFITAIRQLVGLPETNGSNAKIKLHTDNDILVRNLGAMVKTKCAGCRKL